MPARSQRWRGLVDSFLFCPAHPGTAGLLRIALAALLFRTFFSYEGWKLSGRLAYPEIRTYFDTVFFTEPYWWLHTVLLAFFALGVAPRLVAWGLLIVLAPLALNIEQSPGPYIALSLLLGFSWLRSGARYSLLALTRRGSHRDAGPIWPIRSMQLLVSLIYGVNALAKTNFDYLSGDTLVALSTLPNWLMDFSDGSIRFGMIAIPLWLAAPLSALSEWFLAIGFWIPRVRIVAALFGLAFHGALTFIVQIGSLDVITILLYSLFFIPIVAKEGV